MLNKKKQRLIYEAPEIEVVSTEISCSVMDNSIVVPNSLVLPDVVEQEIDWE